MLISIEIGRPTKMASEIRKASSGNVSLRVDLEDFEGNIRYAEYATFKVADQTDKYRIVIGGYSGTAGDGMNEHRYYKQ